MTDSRRSVPDEYRYRSAEYGSDRPCEIARLVQEDGSVTLAFRYTDEDSEWFPTWTGPTNGAVKVPRGWRFTQEWLDRIEAAPILDEVMSTR